MDTDIFEYKLFFANLKTFGIKSIKKLLDTYENEKEIFELDDKLILNNKNLNSKQQNEFIEMRKKYCFEKEVEKLNNNNTKLCFYGDKDYPEKLIDINDAPYQLFYKGKLPDDKRPSVAIIGARMCSDYGLSCARHFSEVLAQNGVQIISGMASGIDGISQRYALERGGESFAVLGSGVDICYPSSNYRLYKDLEARGGLISEFSLNTKPLAMHFPMRNRIISGLSDIVLVIEAKEKSGTAITVNMALEQGRDVYAVPGRINENLSMGCNRIIKEGAGLALSPEDLLEDIDMIKNISVNKCISDKNEEVDTDHKITGIEGEIIRFLKIKEAYIDDIFINCMCETLEELRVKLFEMMLEDKITEKNGLYYLNRHY